MPKDGNGAKGPLSMTVQRGSDAVDAQLKGMEDTVLGGTELEQD